MNWTKTTTKLPLLYKRTHAVWQSKSSRFRFIADAFLGKNGWESSSCDLVVTDDLTVIYWLYPELPE